jgi:putative ABC transport system permease protein
MGRITFIENFLHDIRFGLRLLIKSPVFTIVTILTLALGIGANTAIFSIVNTVLLRPLPFSNPDRLVKITFNTPGTGQKNIPFSVPELEDLRNRAGVFTDVSVIWDVSVNLTGSKQPERLEFLAVSPNYFSMLGVGPQKGRIFGSQDIAEGFAEAVVISDGLWTRLFGKDPNIVGKSVRLDNDLYTIVGVLPADFRHPGFTASNNVELWATAGYSANPFGAPARPRRFLPGAIGRLKDGITLQQAQARLDALSAELQHDFPNDYSPQSKWSIQIQSLQKSLVGDVRPMLLVLMGAVLMIILIASVNIANLLLARASGRQREIAVRMALGASRGRIISQMLTESIILSLLGGIAGAFAASSTLSLIVQFVPSKIPRLNEVSIDLTVLGFAVAVSVLTGLAFGLVPAIQSVKTDIFSAVREGTKGSGYSRRTGLLRDILIVSELALAVILMVGAGLLLRTFWTLLQQNPGFNPSQVVTAGIWIPVPNDPNSDPYNKPGAQDQFVREVLRRVGGLPGVEMAAITTSLPGSGSAFNVALTIEDRAEQPGTDLSAKLISVSPDYLKLMQTSLISGRYFAEDDQHDKPVVVVIDQSTARRFWPNEDAVGKHLKLNPRSDVPWITVIGVIRDIKHEGLDSDGMPHIYSSIFQFASRAMSLAIRTTLPASSLENQIRHEVQAADPSLPLFDVKSMSDIVDASLASRRFSAELVGAFAGLAILLASVGIYGLLAYMVGQRQNEIGVRMALGAQPASIRKLILTKGAGLAGIGVLIGLVLSGVSSQLMASQLYGVRPIDPVVFVAVPGVLLIVALLASYIPARRATKIDPIIALREG